MHLNLLKIELFRMVCSLRFPIVILATVGLVTFVLFSQRPDPLYEVPGNTVRVGLFGLFGMEAPILYVFVAPAIAGIVAAGSLAADISRGYPDLLRVRGITEAGYLVIKALAMFMATFAGTFATFPLSVLLAVLYLPARPTVSKVAVQPLPDLFVYSPMIHDLTVALFLSLGTASLALSGLAVVAIIPNEYAAASFPFVVTVGTAFFSDQAWPLPLLQPGFYLNLTEGYGALATGWQPLAAPIYWSCFSLGCVLLGAHLYHRANR